MIPMDNYVIQNYTGDDTPFAADSMDAEEQKVLIDKALERLSEDDNLLITLFYKADNSIEEISYITGLSVSNVKVKLHRIRKKLYEEMSDLMKQRLN
jgi:RNA polymerase sigma-70 factor (ECF subfamily)